MPAMLFLICLRHPNSSRPSPSWQDQAAMLPEAVRMVSDCLSEAQLGLGLLHWTGSLLCM